MMDSQNVQVQLPYHHSILVQVSTTNHTTSDAGALAMRGLMDTTGILPYLVEHLHDPRDPYRTPHSMKDQRLLPTIQGWELPSKDLGNDYGSLSVPSGAKPLSFQTTVSQPTRSRFWSILGIPGNFEVMQKGLLKLGMEPMLVRNGGERLDEVILDVDAMPVEYMAIHSAAHRMVLTSEPSFCRCFSLVEKRGMSLEHSGTQREATHCQKVMIPIGEQVQAHAADRVTYRFDAGFHRAEGYEA